MLPAYPVSATWNSCKCLLRGKLPRAHCGFCAELKGSGQPMWTPSPFPYLQSGEPTLTQMQCPPQSSPPSQPCHPMKLHCCFLCTGPGIPDLVHEHRNLSRRGLEGNRGSQESCCYCYKSQCSALPGSSMGLGSFFFFAQGDSIPNDHLPNMLYRFVLIAP